MRFRVFISLFMFMQCMTSFSQNVNSDSTEYKKRSNAVFIEFGGAAIIYSVNYSRLFSISEQLRFNAGLGFSYFRFDFFGDSDVFVVPIATSVILGEKKHFFESGLGVTLAFTGSERGIVPTADLSYRYEGIRGLMLKGGLTPMISFNDHPYAPNKVEFNLLPKIGIGYSVYQKNYSCSITDNTSAISSLGSSSLIIFRIGVESILFREITSYPAGVNSVFSKPRTAILYFAL